MKIVLGSQTDPSVVINEYLLARFISYCRGANTNPQLTRKEDRFLDGSVPVVGISSSRLIELSRQFIDACNRDGESVIIEIDTSRSNIIRKICHAF